MSLFEDASLVMIPSGYKAGKVYSIKPSNGDGDFDFTRASAATRVNEQGLIEKERGNLLTYSNDFSNAAWSKTRITITGGQADKDGGTDAFLLNSTATAQSSVIIQYYVSSDVATRSVYAKAGSVNFIALFTTNNQSAYFDLSNGTIGTTTSGIIYAKIESAGNGWYRCSIAVNNEDNIYIFLSQSNGSTSTNTGDNIYIQDAQLEEGLVARDYIETTTTAVYEGITDNVPRLDYTDASCPALKLEPQRTNLVTQSEYFDDAAWTKQTGVTIVPNSATSPDGYQNADLLYSTTGANKRIYQTAAISSGASYTFSVFAKSAGKDFVFFVDIDNVQNTIWFNLSNGTFSTPVEGTATMVDYGNGWYRCSLTTTSTSTTGFSYFGVSDTSGSVTFTESGTDGVLFYGAQLEAGYLTSYIPTYGTSVTFASDSCTKTGASDLIGQTEGTLFVEASALSNEPTNKRISLSDGTNANRVTLNFALDVIGFVVVVNNVASVSTAHTISPNINHKIAFAYKENDFVAYIDGTQVITDTSGSTFSGALNSFRFSDGQAGVSLFAGNTKQTLLFKTRLSNEELEALTQV